MRKYTVVLKEGDPVEVEADDYLEDSKGDLVFLEMEEPVAEFKAGTWKLIKSVKGD